MAYDVAFNSITHCHVYLNVLTHMLPFVMTLDYCPLSVQNKMEVKPEHSPNARPSVYHKMDVYCKFSANWEH